MQAQQISPTIATIAFIKKVITANQQSNLTTDEITDCINIISDLYNNIDSQTTEDKGLLLYMKVIVAMVNFVRLHDTQQNADDLQKSAMKSLCISKVPQLAEIVKQRVIMTIRQPQQSTKDDVERG